MSPLRTEILATLLEILSDVSPPRTKNLAMPLVSINFCPPPTETNPGCAPDYINKIINTRMFRGGARILVRKGEHRPKFHTWFPLKSCIAMASPKFRFRGRTFSKNVLIKDFWKIYKTNLHKKIINSPKFFKNKI